MSDHQQRREELGSDGKLLAALERDTDPTALAEVGHRVLKAGDQWCGRNRFDLGVILYRAIIDRFDGIDDPDLQQLSVHALLSAAEALTVLGLLDEAADAQEAIFKYGDAAVAALDEAAIWLEKTDFREKLAWVLMAKAITLGALQRRDETLAALDEVIERFQTDESPIIQEIVAKAHEGREEVLATDG